MDTQMSFAAVLLCLAKLAASKGSHSHFPVSSSPIFLSDFLDDLMQGQMDQTRHPCSLLGFRTTSQMHCKVTLNLITALITGCFVSSQAADSFIKPYCLLQKAFHLLLLDELNSCWW